MDWDDELTDDEQEKQRQLKQKQKAAEPEDDEGTLEYAERPAFAAVDAQESVLDRGSLNRQQGINTQPSIFHSTWQ